MPSGSVLRHETVPNRGVAGPPPPFLITAEAQSEGSPGPCEGPLPPRRSHVKCRRKEKLTLSPSQTHQNILGQCYSSYRVAEYSQQTLVPNADNPPTTLPAQTPGQSFLVKAEAKPEHPVNLFAKGLGKGVACSEVRCGDCVVNCELTIETFYKVQKYRIRMRLARGGRLKERMWASAWQGAGYCIEVEGKDVGIRLARGGRLKERMWASAWQGEGYTYTVPKKRPLKVVARPWPGEQAMRTAPDLNTCRWYDIRCYTSCPTTPLVGGISRGFPVCPALSFRHCSILTSISLTGARDLAVTSRQNLFAHPAGSPRCIQPGAGRVSYSQGDAIATSLPFVGDSTGNGGSLERGKYVAYLVLRADECELIRERSSAGMQWRDKREFSEKTRNQRRRPARFPLAKILERPRRESNPVCLGEKRRFYADRFPNGLPADKKTFRNMELLPLFVANFAGRISLSTPVKIYAGRSGDILLSWRGSLSLVAGTLMEQGQHSTYSPFTVTSAFSEALLKFYFQDVPPPRLIQKDRINREWTIPKAACSARRLSNSPDERRVTEAYNILNNVGERKRGQFDCYGEHIAGHLRKLDTRKIQAKPTLLTNLHSSALTQSSRIRRAPQVSLYSAHESPMHENDQQMLYSANASAIQQISQTLPCYPHTSHVPGNTQVSLSSASSTSTSTTPQALPNSHPTGMLTSPNNEDVMYSSEGPILPNASVTGLLTRRPIRRLNAPRTPCEHAALHKASCRMLLAFVCDSGCIEPSRWSERLIYNCDRPPSREFMTVGSSVDWAASSERRRARRATSGTESGPAGGKSATSNNREVKSATGGLDYWNGCTRRKIKRLLNYKIATGKMVVTGSKMADDRSTMDDDANKTHAMTSVNVKFDYKQYSRNKMADSLRHKPRLRTNPRVLSPQPLPSNLQFTLRKLVLAQHSTHSAHRPGTSKYSGVRRNLMYCGHSRESGEATITHVLSHPLHYKVQVADIIHRLGLSREVTARGVVDEGKCRKLMTRFLSQQWRLLDSSFAMRIADLSAGLSYMRIKYVIAPTRKALNWRAVFSLCCVYPYDCKRSAHMTLVHKFRERTCISRSLQGSPSARSRHQPQRFVCTNCGRTLTDGARFSAKKEWGKVLSQDQPAAVISENHGKPNSGWLVLDSKPRPSKRVSEGKPLRCVRPSCANRRRSFRFVGPREV
ncbi:hypothetical protein PR048_016378 [Dryococelus australis]|uniref:Uncharacterized protein n=1 Tax=Dryococelus australis TaxID=614101 RepID=A0ABQ9HJJ0_9NEOP|nr:hypothetical protein PR048_016378 [Dryococelus australis]